MVLSEAHLKDSVPVPETRVVVAGGRTFGRYAIRQALVDAHGILVVGEAMGGPEAAREARESQAHVLIYDASMGGDNGLRSLEVIRRQSPRTHVLLIADDPSGEVLFRAVSMGVSGVLGCDTTRDELIRAVRRLGSGGTSPETTTPQDLLDSARGRGGPRSIRRSGPRRSLSRQEVSIVRAIAEGHTDREIADHLAIPIATIKSHVRSILRKTGAVNRTGALAAAFRNRVLE